ncbi:MAG: hypothetical protein AAFN30_04305 [Actinomycetota bacterium]
MSSPLSTSTRPGPQPAPPGPTALGAQAAPQTVAAPAGGATTAWDVRSSPGWYRVFGAIAVASTLALAVLSTTGTFLMRESTRSIQSNTAPSLIAVQGLSASVAEANSNATAAFLATTTGEEDRQRRVAYLDALRRSAEQTEEVAGLIDDDEARHRDLKDVAVALTSYSGSIEAARAAALDGRSGAVGELRTALDLTGSNVADSVARVTEANQARFDEQSGAGTLFTFGGLVAAAAVLALLVFMQVRTFRMSNRFLNLGLLFASAMILATLVTVASGLLSRQSALANASDGGYDAIAATSRLQSSANDVQTELSLRLLGGSEGTDLEGPLAQLTADAELIESIADSDRERAAAQALGVRLERYQSTTATILGLADRGDTESAVETFRGSGFSAFNGLNTSIESVLSDNRAQFDDGVEGAAGAADLLPLLTVVLPLLAAVGIVLGIQRRLRDYQ